MRILLVTQYFDPEPFAVTDVAHGLASRGHEVRVLTGIPNYAGGRFAPGYSFRGPYRERMGELEVLRVPLIPRGRGGSARLALNYLSFAVTASLRAPLLPGPSPDVALVYQMSPVTMAAPALVLRLTHAVPVVVWVQDLWPQSVTAATGIRSPLLLSPLKRFVSTLYRRSTRVLVQSPAFVDAVCSQGAAPRRVRVQPNWADDLYLAPSSGREEEGTFRIVYAGNLGTAQGLDVVLDAASRLGNASAIRWELVGDGARRDEIAAEVERRDLGDRVVVRPRRPAAAMSALFATADALFVSLLPDPALDRTIPSKVQAYLASGRPVLASIDGEAARVIASSGAGVAVAAGDGAALAMAASSLAARPREERDAMGRAGRSYFQAHFSRASLLDRLEASLGEAAREGP